MKTLEKLSIIHPKPHPEYYITALLNSTFLASWQCPTVGYYFVGVVEVVKWRT
jgi:hypothetical protein